MTHFNNLHMSNTTFLLTCLMIVAAVLCNGSDPKLCPGSSRRMLAVTSMLARPYPLQKGKQNLFALGGESFVNGSIRNARLDIYQGNAKIFSANAGNSHSVSANDDFGYTFNYIIPSFVPPGRYTAWINLVSDTGNVFTCVQLDFSF